MNESEDNFASLPLDKQVDIIRMYLSLPTLEGNNEALKRVNEYIEAYHALQAAYANSGHNDPELEKKLRLLMVPMEAAKYLYNEEGSHPVVDMLVESEKVQASSFEKDFTRVRKPKGNIPKLIEDEEENYFKMNGFAMLSVTLILTIILTAILTTLYFYLQFKIN